MHHMRVVEECAMKYCMFEGIVDKMHVPIRALHLQAPRAVGALLPIPNVSTEHPHPTEQVYEGSRINEWKNVL